MQRQIRSVSLFVVWLAGASAFGQDLAFELGNVEGAFGEPAEIPLTLSTGTTEVAALTAVFDWTPSAGTGVELIVVPEIADGASFVWSHADTNWMGLAILGVSLEDGALSPLVGDDILLATAVIQCSSGPEVTETPIVFRDELYGGAPRPLYNLVTVDIDVSARSVREGDGLELRSGSLRCSGPEVCDDAIDNDGDGLTDCEDSECANDIAVTPLSLEFGDVAIGETSELEVTISNTGACDLSVSAVELTAETSADFVVAGVGDDAIPPGEALTALVTYNPSAAGVASGVLRIASDDADEPAVEVTLSGNGLLGGVPQIAGDCNQDGTRNISDVICMIKLTYPGFNLLDQSTQTPPCSNEDGTVGILDVNGDTQLNSSDIVLLADFLFVGSAPPAQGLECFGLDEALGCSQNAACP